MNEQKVVSTRFPLCSIIIPFFNRRNTLSETINSCILQDYPNIEVILVDDGSTDNGADVCRDLEEKNRTGSKTIRLVKQANAGACAARNRGMAEAKGEFLLFLDSDDLIPPNKISTQIDAIEKKQADCCISDFLTIDSNGLPISIFHNNLTPIDFVRKLKSPSNSAILMRRASIPQYMKWNEALPRMQDFDFMLRYLSCVTSWTYVPEPLYFYRLHNGPRISDSYVHGMPYGALFLSMARHIMGIRPAKASYFVLLIQYGLGLLRASLKDLGSQLLSPRIKTVLKRFLRP